MDANTKKKRLSKKTVRAIAWAAGGVAFAVPWAAFQFVPTATSSAQGTTSPQVIVVPAGSKVTVLSGPSGATGVKVIRTSATTTTTASAPTVKSAPVTTTGASAPPP
jgi:hypothetical protein